MYLKEESFEPRGNTCLVLKQGYQAHFFAAHSILFVVTTRDQLGHTITEEQKSFSSISRVRVLVRLGGMVERAKSTFSTPEHLGLHNTPQERGRSEVALQQPEYFDNSNQITNIALFRFCLRTFVLSKVFLT